MSTAGLLQPVVTGVDSWLKGLSTVYPVFHQDIPTSLIVHQVKAKTDYGHHGCFDAQSQLAEFFSLYLDVLCLKRNCKIPIISPGLIIFKKFFLLGLFTQGSWGLISKGL